MLDRDERTRRQKIFGRWLTVALIVAVSWVVGGDALLEDGDPTTLLFAAGVLVVPMLPATWAIANLTFFVVLVGAARALVAFDDWLRAEATPPPSAPQE